ncbi:MAG: hypothetical protein AMJ79_00210 [Phycisphaerae bacterium SM23_30]|nr:MAG: hypothetical protein AMJ79_00210 [Phycisphaerae bacterium SM23_30]
MVVTLSRIMLLAAVVVFAVTGAAAAPKVTASTYPSHAPANPVWNCAPQLASVNHNILTQEFSPEFEQNGNSSLADIGREMLKPSSALFDETPLTQSSIKNLPALPGAILMSVIGFLSVTLVRDRKFWMSIFAGLFLLSQTGMQTVPKLTARLARGRLPENQPAAFVSDPYQFNHAFSLAGRYECIHYAGLLHRLAGSPDEESALINISGEGNALSCVSPILSAKRTTQLKRPHDISLSPQPALIASNHHLSPSSVYQVRRPESSIYFSPGFIFENLPRGPPRLAVLFP